MSPAARANSLLIRRVSTGFFIRNIASKSLASRSIIRSISSTAGHTAPPKRSLLRRAVSGTFRALFFTTIGFIMATAPAYETVAGYVTPKTDEDMLGAWTPSTADEQAHEDHLNAHPLTQSLRANPAFAESRPHLKIPPAWRANNLTAGTLMGPNRVPFPPVAWHDVTGAKKEYVQVSYVGAELCGHPGIVHGGYLATVLDEGLARPAFAALPHGVGMTASLTVNYKAPCMAGQYIVMRGEVTRSEGRKAWVEGRVETLPVGDEKPVVLAEATALYIEPKQVETLSKYYSAN